MKYIKALETEKHIYYVDLTESDENGNTKIYDKQGILLSDNVHAYNSLIDDLESVLEGKLKPIYIYDEVLENARMLLEQE